MKGKEGARGFLEKEKKGVSKDKDTEKIRRKVKKVEKATETEYRKELD